MSDGKIAKTEWERRDAPYDEPFGIYLEALGNGTTGGVIVYYEGRNNSRCIEWNSYADLAKWKKESAVFFENIKAASNTHIPNQERQSDSSDTKVISQEKRPNIPKGYKGDSIAELIKKFEAIEAASKDEFTKKTIIREKLANLRSASSYRFIFERNIDSFLSDAKYDVEKEILNISLRGLNRKFPSNSLELLSRPPHFISINLAQKLLSKDYVGQNSYGASTKVTEIYAEHWGVAFNNVSSDNLLSLSIPIPPVQAKALKADFAYYIDVELVESNGFKGEVLVDAFRGDAPTISNPTRNILLYKFLLANVREIGVFSKKSGEIIGWRKF